MSNRRIAIAAVIAVAIILAIIIGTFVAGSSGDNAKIEVPEVSNGPDTQRSDTDGTDADGLNRVEVTADSVQEVIASLSRPASYTRDITVTTWSETSSAENRMKVSVKNEAVSIVLNSEPEKHTVFAGDKLYIWYAGDSEAFVSALSEDASAKTLSDELQMMVTYEDVLELDRASISDAGYVQKDGQLCIFVTYTSGQLGYTTTCYISSKLGLVVGAQRYDGGELVYEMKSGDCVTGVEDMSVFELPDGTSAA